jgi:hypothetical protein
MAHVGDAELWAGGTLHAHGRAAQVDIAVDLAEPSRLTQPQTAADVLGARLHFGPFYYPDVCVELLRHVRPEVIVTHDPRSTQDDHRLVATALLAGLEQLPPCELPRRLYRCQTLLAPSRDQASLAARIVDITAVYERKLEALAAYDSFTGSGFPAMVERQTRFWGDHSGVERAEAFLPLPILGRLPCAEGL